MNLDGILLHKYKENIEKYLPLKINKIQQFSNDCFIFNVRHKQNLSLLLSLNPQSYRIHFTKKQYNTSFEPTSFLMLLRKHLTQANIIAITQPKGDRVLVLTIQTYNNLKDKITLKLYIEFFGKYTNLILVNENNKIIDCLKRNHLDHQRALFPKASFTTTHQENKYSVFESDNQPITNYNGLSKCIQVEIAYQKFTIKQLVKKVQQSDTIYYYPTKNLFHCIPLTNLQETAIQYSLKDALDEIYHQNETTKRINEVSGNIYRHVKKELEKATNKLTKLNNSLKDALDYQQYQQYGDILYMYAYMKEHSDRITVDDFEGNSVTIILDPKYDIKENAKRYYKKYTKAKTAVKMLHTQIEKTEENIQYYLNIQSQLELIQLEDALEIAEELKLNRKQNIQSKKQKYPNFLKLSIDNVEIYVGKNNIQNDYITNKISKKHYLWFHVKDFHGSHVVVNQSEVSEKILRICASLAAYYSKARYSSSIPVNYCLLKQLKATRGNQIGMVFLGNYKTIYIDIDEKEIFDLIAKYEVKMK